MATDMSSDVRTFDSRQNEANSSALHNLRIDKRREGEGEKVSPFFFFYVAKSRSMGKEEQATLI